MGAEISRLKQNHREGRKWHIWGPYLSERQWGTVREDYSANGDAWGYFTHDLARSRVYRWGEDGIAGISDIKCNLCFSLAVWNGKDSILKERLFGLTGPEGNHGEDVKELYYYLDNTPTHSYMKYLYKYSHNQYPYGEMVNINRRRGLQHLEYEILDTDLFTKKDYFDIFITYAKKTETDICIKISVKNRSNNKAKISILPTLLFRNDWGFKFVDKIPILTKQREADDFCSVMAQHPRLYDYFLYFDKPKKWLFTENNTNAERLFGIENESPYVKDLFHEVVINDDFTLTDQRLYGTKFSPLYEMELEGKSSASVKLRLSNVKDLSDPLGEEFLQTMQERKEEANEFYNHFSDGLTEDDTNILRQALSGMLWTKQYYNLNMEEWLKGDPKQPNPEPWRKYGRNSQWKNLINEDIISMPDKWEYPWYAAWDLAFHCIPLALLDPSFAKHQMSLVLREWYMSTKGQIPAYEWSFSDVNPPVQAWATFKVYEIDKKITGKGDVNFLKKIFNKLVINFTWWVNQKDKYDKNIFEGGFLGLDNIGIFDRSQSMPGGGHLEQADGTAWMALYALNMLQIALEISKVDNSYEEMATKFFEHFVYIAESLNSLNEDGKSLWDEIDGFFFDVLVRPNNEAIPLKTRSLVGLMTLNPVMVISNETLESLPGFKDRMVWFRNYRKKSGKYLVIEHYADGDDIMLALVPKDRMKILIKTLIDEQEFLSDYGIRSLSKIHKKPYSIKIDGAAFGIRYDPAEATSYMFGGNSNWRGPIWIPMNYIIIESLKEYHKYYGNELSFEFPKGTGNMMNALEISLEISHRLVNLFRKNEDGDRPINQSHRRIYRDKKFNDLVLFYEYFHGDSGRGLGASHQTGWTGIVANLILDLKEHNYTGLKIPEPVIDKSVIGIPEINLTPQIKKDL
ncbi:MAG: glucosidase [Saprospiraceae bacterium]|nr:glucosidase [Saprospiraceae bacterium]